MKGFAPGPQAPETTISKNIMREVQPLQRDCTVQSVLLWRTFRTDHCTAWEAESRRDLDADGVVISCRKSRWRLDLPCRPIRQGKAGESVLFEPSHAFSSNTAPMRIDVARGAKGTCRFDRTLPPSLIGLCSGLLGSAWPIMLPYPPKDEPIWPAAREWLSAGSKSLILYATSVRLVARNFFMMLRM